MAGETLYDATRRQGSTPADAITILSDAVARGVADGVIMFIQHQGGARLVVCGPVTFNEMAMNGAILTAAAVGGATNAAPPTPPMTASAVPQKSDA